MPRAYQCRRCKGPPLKEEWEGPCPHCGGYYRPIAVFVREGEVEAAMIQPIKDGVPISASDLLSNCKEDQFIEGRPSGMPGLDWLFNGLLPLFGAILLCAKEGAGKSTFLWGLFQALAARSVETLYITAEQSLKDLRRQFARCGAPASHMTVLSENDHDAILRVLESRAAQVVALDSLHEIENVTDEDGNRLASGGPAAVTRVAKEIRRLSGDLDFLAFLVGHVNNDGTLSGGAHLRHAVDATLVLGRNEDSNDPRRILEFQGKTRFGPLGRRALLMMGEHGLKDHGPFIEEQRSSRDVDGTPEPMPRKKGRFLN